MIAVFRDFFAMSCALFVQEEESTGFIFRATILVQVEAKVMGRKKQGTMHGDKSQNTTTI
jgi:hypothetical protein